MSVDPEERDLTALATALKTVPVDSGRAWRPVWGRVQARATGRHSWPAAASLSVLAVFLACAQLGVAGVLAEPAFASGEAPAPRTLAVTPASGPALAVAQHPGGAPLVTDVAPRMHAPTPIPLPPGKP
jgi:hypothetical protein